MILGTSVVWLPVTDLDVAVAFYRDRLGLDVSRVEDEWAELSSGDDLRIGLNATESESPRGDGGAVIAFRPSGSLEDAVAALSQSGVRIAGDISEHPWGRIATFRDPDDNDLQLYEPPQG